MKQDVTESLSERLRMLRKESGKSQEMVAVELGISRSCLSNYENGLRQPDNHMLLRLADYFHVLADYLINRNDTRQLQMSMQETKEIYALSEYLQQRGRVLDITKLSGKERLSMLSFYNYIKQKERSNKKPVCCAEIVEKRNEI